MPLPALKKFTMKNEIKKINSEEENQEESENVIKQIKKVIDNEEISLKQEVIKRISYTKWEEEIKNKPSWEEAKDYGNRILALIFIHNYS